MFVTPMEGISMWSLILTLVVCNAGCGATTTSIPGFISLEACQIAGNAWQNKVIYEGIGGVTKASLCVPKG